MIRKIVGMMIALMAINVSAQEFKGAQLYDAYGSVKEIKYKEGKFSLMRSTLKFWRDGFQKASNYTYNLEKYPIGYGFQMGYGYINCLFYYDTDNRLEKVIINKRYKTNFDDMVVTNSYNDGKLIGRCIDIKSNGDMGNTVIEWSYSQPIYDSHGNWTQHTVTQTTTKEGTLPEVKTFVERREIKYWE